MSHISVNTAALWLQSKWRPAWLYSWKSFRELFGFGSKLALSGLINTLYANIFKLVIGKVFKASDLGFYTRAHGFAELSSQTLTSVIQRVTYPALCTIQNDDARLSDVYRRFLRMTAFIIFPMMTILGVLARPVILTFLNEQWLFSASLLPVICIALMWYPIHAINLNLLQVKGRSDLFLKLEIWKKVIGIVIMCATIPFGLLAMCWGSVASNIIALVINTHYTGRLIGIGFFTQMKDLLPVILQSAAMGAAVWLISLALPPEWLKLVAGTLAGMAIYLLISRLSGSSDLRELLSLIKNK